LLFLLLYATGCLLAFVRHPIFGLVTYVLVLYVNPPSRWWGELVLVDFRWSFVAAGVTLLAVLLRPPRKHAIPIGRHVVTTILILFVVWIWVQSTWALDSVMQKDLVTTYMKFLLVIVMIYAAVDSEEHLRAFLWAHVLGCAYFGWLAFATYEGGRFGDFGGGSGLGEANAAALQLATGVMVAAALFLDGKWRERAILIVLIALILNAMVTTISRSGFLALATGALLFNIFAPRKYRVSIHVLTVLGGILFLMVTNPVYWQRMASLKHAGEEVEQTDTGSDRLAVMQGQLQMFRDHPLGCGHRCTGTLSPYYLDASLLWATEEGGPATRTSHNTFLTLLVEQGIPGAIFYVAMLGWMIRRLAQIHRCAGRRTGLVSSLLPAIMGACGAIAIGDMFVDYLKLEARIWFIALIMVVTSLAIEQRPSTVTPNDAMANKAKTLRGSPAHPVQR